MFMISPLMAPVLPVSATWPLGLWTVLANGYLDMLDRTMGMSLALAQESVRIKPPHSVHALGSASQVQSTIELVLEWQYRLLASAMQTQAAALTGVAAPPGAPSCAPLKNALVAAGPAQLGSLMTTAPGGGLSPTGGLLH